MYNEEDRQHKVGIANDWLLGISLFTVAMGLMGINMLKVEQFDIGAVWAESALGMFGLLLYLIQDQRRIILRMLRFVALTYSLPFFFSYMYLANTDVKVWSLGILFAFIALTSYLKPKYLWPSIFSGSFGAVVANDLYGSGVIPEDVFIVMGSCFAVVLYFSYHNSILEREYREKVEVMKGIGATIAHELRTPLTTISMGVQGIGDDFKELEQAGLLKDKGHLRQLMENVGLSCERAHMTINLFLTNLKKVSGEELETCSIQKCVRESLEEYPLNSKDQGVIQIKSNDDFKFIGSEEMMKHVFYNLYKNALHYMHGMDKRALLIDINKEDNWGWIKVRDNGTGISEEHLPYIFDQYFTKRQSGMGLGLYYCKRCVEEYGGKIECHSKESEYTEFRIGFPLIKA